MVPLEKSTKNQNKNGTILEKFQNSGTKKVPFEYSLKNLKTKIWYHLGKVRKI